MYTQIMNKNKNEWKKNNIFYYIIMNIMNIYYIYSIHSIYYVYYIQLKELKKIIRKRTIK